MRVSPLRCAPVEMTSSREGGGKRSRKRDNPPFAMRLQRMGHPGLVAGPLSCTKECGDLRGGFSHLSGGAIGCLRRGYRGVYGVGCHSGLWGGATYTEGDMRLEMPRRLSPGKQMRWLRRAGCAAGLSCAVTMCCGAAWARGGVDTAAAARTRAAKKIVALSPWEQAEQAREALEAISEETRTRADYTRAMDAYRMIYHANPADLHAAAAVNAVAELLAEQGRALHDAKSLGAAVGQYEFLRKQYPASSLGVQALLAEGQIEQDDLGDAALAKEKYKLLLKEHSKSEQAEEAKAGLASLEVQGSRSEVRGKVGQADAVSPPTSSRRCRDEWGSPDSAGEGGWSVARRVRRCRVWRRLRG